MATEALVGSGDVRVGERVSGRASLESASEDAFAPGDYLRWKGSPIWHRVIAINGRKVTLRSDTAIGETEWGIGRLRVYIRDGFVTVERRRC